MVRVTSATPPWTPVLPGRPRHPTTPKSARKSRLQANRLIRPERAQSSELRSQFIPTGMPVAAICHGPWTLVEADAVRAKNRSLKDFRLKHSIRHGCPTLAASLLL